MVPRNVKNMPKLKSPKKLERRFVIYGVKPTSKLFPACCRLWLSVDGRKVSFDGFEAAPISRHYTPGSLPERYLARALRAIKGEHPTTWGKLETVWRWQNE
jgi:hypothetical protein